MEEHSVMIPCFESFCAENCGVSPVLEMLITETGTVIPSSEWKRISTHVRNPRSFLNFGADSEENLTKYVDKQGPVGPVATITVPLSVRVDQTDHAAHQQYRWEHRHNQVTDEEVLSDIKMAAPKIIELVLNDGLALGTGTSKESNTNTNYNGQVWLYNIQTGLNMIVQAKYKEQRDHAIKILIVTMIRQHNMTWSKASVIPKITLSSTEARIVYVPKQTRP